jgi:hypothetical protein
VSPRKPPIDCSSQGSHQEAIGDRHDAQQTGSHLLSGVTPSQSKPATRACPIPAQFRTSLRHRVPHQRVDETEHAKQPRRFLGGRHPVVQVSHIARYEPLASA